MIKYVKISIDRLMNLLNRDTLLSALEAGGVDNWEWFGESQPDESEIWTEDDILANFEEVK